MGEQVVEPYRDIPHSIEKVSAGIQTDRNDRELQVWAIHALRSAGCDGRANDCSIRRKVQVLLDALRAQTIYVPDPVGSEHIQATHVTLCLRDKCIPAEDCDGLIRALVSALLSIGINAYIVVQEFGPGIQPHVLAGVIDEHGDELYADPANTTAPVYTGSRAVREEWINPVSPEMGWKGPEMVTLGSVPDRRIHRQGGLWVEERYGKKWVYRGNAWHEVGLGTVVTWHTAHELSDLLDALTYQEKQLTNAAAKGAPEWVNIEPKIMAAWYEAYQATEDQWQPIVSDAQQTVEDAKTRIGGWDWNVTVSATFGDAFDAVTKAFAPFKDLDLQLRASKFPKQYLPDYSATPKGNAPNFDASVYQIAANFGQQAKQFGQKVQSFMEGAAPWLALGGIVFASYAVIQVVNVLPVARRRR